MHCDYEEFRCFGKCCGYDEFIWIVVNDYGNFKFLLALYFYSLCLAPWKTLLSYAFGTTLDFIIVSHYKYALNVLSKLFVWFYYIFASFLYNVWYFTCSCLQLRNCLSLLWNVTYLCRYYFYHIYYPHGIYRINSEMFTFTLQSR